MQSFDRLPAIPLIAEDPYFSVWLPGDLPNDCTAVHWTGAEKPVSGFITVDGERYRFLGSGGEARALVQGVAVTPTKTEFTYLAGGVSLKAAFRSCALPDDLDVLSTPITMADFEIASEDGAAHKTQLSLSVSRRICFDGATEPQIFSHSYRAGEMGVAYLGRSRQCILGHSADHITIDWGYFYMASSCPVSSSARGAGFSWEAEAGNAPKRAFALLGYDDIASVNYFGTPCRAWYARGGKTFRQALEEFFTGHDRLVERCEALDAQVLERAGEIGGRDYQEIACAAWRHSFAAHKLIATPEGELALLSKENDSNGCIGTVDVSYPSAPLFLEFCPELVNALCRPVLEFASMPVWEFDFAPHDVGRYPYATGQAYALDMDIPQGAAIPPVYQYPAGTEIYLDKYQMPVEECGNMLIMLEAALHYGASDGLLRKYSPILEKWAGYLLKYGEDPGSQLCTDDFAGHLARNVNLAAKAIVGIACFGRLQKRLGREQAGAEYRQKARELAESWQRRAAGEKGTYLTFDKKGWSMKYNLAWDRVLGLDLLPEDFYRRETESYLEHINTYGLPLDSRADYTKSDWICWCAAMAPEESVRRALLAPVAKYVRETATRVPFSDWYDTRTGRYVAFIARSVQGGVFMPFLSRPHPGTPK